MRKLLIILGTIGLTTITSTSVIACSSTKQTQPGNPDQDLISSLITQLTTTSNTISKQTTQINTLIATNTNLKDQLTSLVNSNITNQNNITTLIDTLSANQLQLRTLFTTQGSLSTRIGTLTQQIATAKNNLILVRAGTSWKIDTTNTTSKSLIRKFKNAATGEWSVEKWMLKDGTSYGLDRYINGIEFDPFGTWTANTTTTLNYFAQLGFKAALVNGATRWQSATTAFIEFALSGDEQVTALQNQLAEAKKTISSNTDVINSLTTTNNNLTTTINNLKTGNTNQSDLITTLNQIIDSQNAQIGTTSASNATLQIQVNDLTNQLSTANTELSQASASNGWVIDSSDTTNKTITRTYKNPNTSNWQTEKVIVATGGTTLNRTIDNTSYPYQNAMNANEGTAQTLFKSLGFNLVQVNSQWVFSILTT